MQDSGLSLDDERSQELDWRPHSSNMAGDACTRQPSTGWLGRDRKRSRGLSFLMGVGSRLGIGFALGGWTERAGLPVNGRSTTLATGFPFGLALALYLLPLFPREFLAAFLAAMLSRASCHSSSF